MNYLLSDFQLSAKANFFKSCPDLSLRVITAMEARGNGRKRERNIKVSHFSNKKKQDPYANSKYINTPVTERAKCVWKVKLAVSSRGRWATERGQKRFVKLF